MAEDIKNEKSIETSDTNVNNMNKIIVDVVYSVKPILFCERLFGIFRLRLINEQLRVADWKFKSLALLAAISVFISYFVTLSRDFPSDYDVQDIADEISYIVIVMQYIMLVLAASFLFNNITICLIKTFADIDNMLHVETIPDFYTKSRSHTNIIIIFLIVTHIIISFVDLVTSDNEYFDIWTVIFLPLYFVQKLEITYFCKFIAMTRQRLSVVNTYLMKFTQDQEKKGLTLFTVNDAKRKQTEENYNFIGRPSPKNTKIRDLARIYDTIGDISSMINDGFNFQVFMTLISTFFFIIMTMWSSLHYYKTDDSELKRSGHLINNAIWCASTIFIVAAMAFSCERLLLVRNKTKVLVNKIIMNYDLPNTMRVQAKAFMELIEAWSLRIFVYDMFSVDITLMLKFISVATTYLIVIIQISHFV